MRHVPSSQPLASALGSALGSELQRLTPVSGGDINRAYRAELADGRRVFVKTHHNPPSGMYTAEVEGLRFLALAGADLVIPQALAWSEGGEGTAPFLALPWLQPRRADHAAEQALGRGLAALHRSPAPLGLTCDNYIATLPQANGPEAEWPVFYAQRRLRPMAARAHALGHLSAAARGRVERLCARLDGLLATDERPGRLHGDLWGGNAMFTDLGPAVFDPAPYGGHREIDLAMMHLFGGFSSRCFAAYEESYPLSAGHAERRPLYQLYPLLVHAVLFGGHYGGQVDSIVRRFAL